MPLQDYIFSRDRYINLNVQMVTLVFLLHLRITPRVLSNARLSPGTVISTVSKLQNKQRKQKIKIRFQYFSKATTHTVNKNIKVPVILKTI